MSLFGNTNYSMPGYVNSMRDAHRKPAQAITTPALTWHMGFKKDVVFESSESEWIERIELLIIDIFYELVEQDEQVKIERAEQKKQYFHANTETNEALPDSIGNVLISNLCGRPVSATHTDEGWTLGTLKLLRHAYQVDSTSVMQIGSLEAEGSRYEAVVIEATWKKLNVHLRLEIFDDYFAVSVTVSLRFGQGVDASNTNIYCSAFNDIVDAFEYHDGSIRSNVGFWEIKRTIEDKATTLYEGIWADFSNNAFAKPFSNLEQSDTLRYSDETARHRFSLRELRRMPIGEELFADFRGIVFVLDANGVNGRLPWSSYRRAVAKTAPEFGTLHEGWLNADCQELKGELGRKRADELSSVLYAAQPIDGIFLPPFEATEYTFSTLNEGRCLYGTSFGCPQTENPSPMHYVLLFAHDDYREIGLTVNTLHSMGSSQLSMLRGFERVISRDSILVNLDQEFQHMQTTLLARSVQERQHRAIVEAGEYLQDLTDKLSKLPYPNVFITNDGPSVTDYISLLKGHFADVARLKELSAHGVTIEAWNDNLRSYRKTLSALRRQTGEILDNLNERLYSAAQKNPPNLKEYRYIKEVRRNCSNLSRRLDVLIDCTSPKEYRHIVVGHMERALASLDKRIKRGLSFQSDQTEANLRQFLSLSDTLKIEKVIGYQPYDRFVLQRLERSFHFIDSVGTRYRLLKEKMQRMRHELDEEKRGEKRTAMLFWAEAIALMAILPHYLALLVLSFADTFYNLPCDANGNRFLLVDGAKCGQEALTTLAFVCGAAFVFYRRFVRERKKNTSSSH